LRGRDGVGNISSWDRWAGQERVGHFFARGWPVFVDSDEEIERRTGVDIAYIFEKEGEAGFRSEADHRRLTGRAGLMLATAEARC
jgi:shikimate kinase